MDKKKKEIIITIIAIVLVLISATYAWITWRSTNNTNVDITIGELIKFKFKGGNAINITSLAPVIGYEDQDPDIVPVTDVTVINNLGQEYDIKFYLNIISIDNNLKNEAVKYVLLQSTDNINYTELTTGNFVNATTGNDLPIIETTVSSGKTYYKFLIYLDGTNINATDLQNKTLQATLIGESIDPPPASETIMALSSGDSWESGASGVYATNSYTDIDSSTKYHEYRYVGANVNNYVSFNNDMYRIIGVFDSNSHGRDGEYLVKLIAVNPLGGYSWGVYSTSNTSGTYSNYANDWTGTTTGVKANLNVLLNEYFVNKAVTSSTYGNCSDWTYYYSNTNYRTNDCSDIVGYGIGSSLRDYIETTTWYLYGSGSHQSKQNWYLCERGGNSCTSAYKGAYSATTDAKIGLMYLSDYLYASGYYSSSDTTYSGYPYVNQNWLYKGIEWTITPYAFNSSDVWRVFYGYANNDGTNYPYVWRPSFYLKSSVYVTGGSGTFDDPYTIGCNDCTL